ncbi:Yaf9p [Perkinsela sp. CCAP 1560/4]|nr:Yaf9p [Perkinsela sp. CCAP 1560/4]|eukprot:KNH06953.1 Yaf9p [Perkinsela sp. CCAP 1560/4]
MIPKYAQLRSAGERLGSLVYFRFLHFILCAYYDIAMSGLFHNSEGFYQLDMSIAAATIDDGEVSIKDFGELIRFVASYLSALEIFDKAFTADQVLADASAWFRDVRLASSMSLLLIPKEYLQQIWISFGTVFPRRIFIDNLQSFGSKAVGSARVSRVPLIVGSVSSPSREEGKSHAHCWNVYVRFLLSEETIKQLITKVVFELHETFTPQTREISAPGPFEVSEMGWGEFVIGIEVYFTHGGMFKTSHQLQIFPRTPSVTAGNPENMGQSNDRSEPVRNEFFKTIEIPSELLSEGINQAIQAFDESFDKTAETEQNTRLNDVCVRLESCIRQERKLLSSLQQRQLFRHHQV